MKLNELNGFVVDLENKLFGVIAGIDFMENKVSILTEDGIGVAKLENVKFLAKVGNLGNKVIVNHDVVQTADGRLFEVELIEEDKVQLFLLDRKLKRVANGDVIPKNIFHTLENVVKYVGNVFQLEPFKDVDFNIRVVRTNVLSGEHTYYYACNNKDVAELDLIKVVFVGDRLLKEEDYKRFTLTYTEYLEMVNKGAIKEVNPQELMNYVSGLRYGLKPEPKPELKAQVLPTAPVETEERCGNCDVCECECDNVEHCDECGRLIEDCECEDWE